MPGTAAPSPRIDRARRRLVAGAMVFAPLLLLAGSALEVDTGDDSGAATLARVAADREQFYAAGLLMALGLAALAAAAVGLAQLARGRGGVLTAVGAALLFVAGPAAGAGIFLYTAVLYTATAPGMGQDALAAFDVAASDSLALGVPFMVGFLGLALGFALLGIGLLRARTVPMWMAAVLTVSGLLTWFADSTATIVLTSSSLLVLVGLAVELVRSRPVTVVLPDVPDQRASAPASPASQASDVGA